MGRLIDADAVEDMLKKCVNNAFKRKDHQSVIGLNLAILELRNVPTAYDVEIRAKAIDEFANRLYSKIKAEIDDCADELDWIEEIAEQIKGSEKHG